MILMVAPGPSLTFGGMPSGVVYVSSILSLVQVANDNAADQAALQAAGCATLSPFGSWGNFGFTTLANLYSADAASNLVLPGVTGFPLYTVATVFNDSGNTGTWNKTSSGVGAGHWTQVSTQTLAGILAAIPWAGTTFAQVSQVKAALVADGNFAAVEAAILADPTNAASQQWTGGAIALVGGPLGTAIKTALSFSTGQMNTLWAAAAAEPY